jgi:hypothetical protein
MPTRGTAYDNAAYLKGRYADLRRLGLCIDCKKDSPDGARCKVCREKFNAGQRKDAA